LCNFKFQKIFICATFVPLDFIKGTETI